jgi:hypothetical protein
LAALAPRSETLFDPAVDDAGELASLPAEWTDVAAGDPFVVVSAGRSAFRTADLLELAELIAGLLRNANSRSEDVKRITP